MNKFHLKGLDSLRAIAAIIVLISHIELFKRNYGYANYFESSFFQNTGGHVAVILFFCLSGFLITFLLIKEKEQQSEISLKSFYLRRIFRVWPLYYIIIITSYFIFDYSPSLLTTLLCITVFPNIAHAMGASWAVSPQIWSIGVEEQFYLVWPLIVKKSKNVLLASLFIFLFFALLPHVILFVLNRVYPNPELMKLVNRIFYGAKFSCMAMGSLLAILYTQKSQITKVFNSTLFISYLFIILPFILWFSGYHVAYFNDEMYAVLFSISILNLSTHPSVINIDFGITSFLGKISYGIYMYHWMVLELVFRNKLIPKDETIFSNGLLYLISIGATLLLSSFSYFYIESYFLKLKEKYSRV